MLLGNLLESAKHNRQKIFVKGISFDSRKVKKNNIFFAINGNKTSGSKFIKEAILKKAAAIVTNKKFKYKSNKVPIVLVKNVRKSLAEACSKLYKKKPLNIIAVTGTNGKSSVAYFFYQILAMNNIAAATIGTLGIISKKYKKKTNLTSLDPLSLHKYLQILARKKINHVILEASSHGLDQKRLDNLNIKIGIFTNLSHDHLDYHKDIKSYLNSKMYLFKNLINKNSKIITDEENKEYKAIKNISNNRKIKIITIGQKSGYVKILDNKYKKNRQLVKISINSKVQVLDIPLIGFFQVKNLLMAVLAASNFGIDKNKIFKQINKIKAVPGRLENVAKLNNNSNILVDFAHTPDALEKSLIAIKNQFKKEIIIVLGCGGERDKKKRFIMGKIAKKYCRKVFVTDDNPRNESPKKIRKAIIKGCKELAVDIGSRKKAIEAAIKELKPRETLLVTGKGHENTQDYGKKIINFSDQKEIKKIIKKKNIVKFRNINHSDINNIKNFNYSNVSINSKDIKKNDLFFAIKGKKKDGHNFVCEAVKKGATKIVISKSTKNIPYKKIIRVKNTLSSLNNLAKSTRENSEAKIIGITGSVGKTTLKNLLSFALKNYGKVHNSPRSYNNKFGVPLSISNLKNDIDYGVFEIGMDKKGEIDKLSKIVKPEIAVITNIGGAHFKNFNSLKDIAKAKGEIINNILEKGIIILNKDDKFFSYLSTQAKKKGIKVISISCKRKADIQLLKITKTINHFKMAIIVKNKKFRFKIKHCTENFINNLLACIAVISSLNLNLHKLNKKFIDFTIPNGRGDIKKVKMYKKKFTFIDESYNANPLSMTSAIKNMNYYKIKSSAKKLVFLGDMLELGKKSLKFHKDLSTVINKSNIDKVFVYGKYIRETFKSLKENKKGKVFSNLREAHNHFSKIIHNNDLLMVKGSNATGLNQFSKNIKRG